MTAVDRRPVSKTKLLNFYRQMFDQSGFAEETEAVMKALPQGADAAAERISDRMLASVAIWGSPEHCRRRLEEYRSLGVAHPVVAPWQWVRTSMTPGQRSSRRSPGSLGSATRREGTHCVAKRYRDQRALPPSSPLLGFDQV